VKTNHYHHTQIGWVILGSIVPVPAILVPSMAFVPGTGLVAAILCGIIVVTLLLFAWLTVDVDGSQLLATMGIGLVRKRVPLAEVRYFSVEKTPWRYGWGIRRIPGGILYNVSGTWSVELVLHDGSRVRIGTNEPDALRGAIAKVLGEPTPLAQAEIAWKPRGSRRLSIAIIAIATALVVATTVLMWLEGKPTTITVGHDALSIKSLIYGGDIPWSEVSSVTLKPSLPRITLRTNGYAVGGTLRGYFNIEGMGNGQVYVEANTPPFILVRTRRSFVLLNDAAPDRTASLFADIQAQRVAGSR
jgi:hypothetical protein